MDQRDSLEKSEGAFESERNSKKEYLLEWIDNFSSYKCIFSTSANYKAYVAAKGKQDGKLKLHVYGGLSAVSPLSTLC